MKAIEVSPLSSEERLQLLKELRRLAELRHPHLCGLRECFLHQGKLCTVLDYLPGGNLAAEVAAGRDLGDKVLLWFTQALLAVDYLHRMEVLHRDLRLRQLLLTREGLVVLTGVALSAILKHKLSNERPEMEVMCYLAPEILLGTEEHSCASDMWAMGVILYELAALKPPWNHADLAQLRDGLQRPLRPLAARHAELSPLCYSLLKRRRFQRPSAAMLLQHPLIQKRLLVLLKCEHEETCSSWALPTPAHCWNSGAAGPGPRPAVLFGRPRGLEASEIWRDAGGAVDVGAPEQRGQWGSTRYLRVFSTKHDRGHARTAMGQCWPCHSRSLRGWCLVDRDNLETRSPVYSTLRRLAVDSARAGALELSVLRLNFNPSRKFQNVYRVGARLGDGSFGSVHECEVRATQEARAVKLLLKSRMKDAIGTFSNRRYAPAIANEIEILTKLDHPNVVKFYEFFEDRRSVLCVVELCRSGDFCSSLEGKSKDTVRVLFRDVMLGLAYLHSFGIAHRDLKPSNCVLTFNGKRDLAKIIDFGLGAIRRQEDEAEEWMSEVLGTLAFVAPEVVEQSYNEKCDCWSFGIMVFMQLTEGQHPYDLQSRASTFNLSNRQLLARLRLEDPDLSDAKGRDLVSGLLVRDPAQRLSAQEALQKPWLRPRSVRESETRRMSRQDAVGRDRKLLRHSLGSYKDLAFFDKAVLLMASHFQQPEVSRRASEIFMSKDLDNSGYLNEEELQGALEAVGMKPDAELQDAWRSLDTSEDGRVSYSEWLSWAAQTGSAGKPDAGWWK
eukprot:g19805.t2